MPLSVDPKSGVLRSSAPGVSYGFSTLPFNARQLYVNVMEVENWITDIGTRERSSEIGEPIQPADRG